MNAAELHASLVAAAPTDPNSPVYGEAEFGGDVFANLDCDRVWHQLHSADFLSHRRHVIEIGPGGGRWTRHFAAWCDHYTAVDATDRVWDHLQRFLFRFQTPPTLIISKDGNLPSAPGEILHRSADLVFSYDTHVHFHRELFFASVAAMCGCVAPGGLLVLHHATEEGKQSHQPLTPRDLWHNVPIATVDEFICRCGTFQRVYLQIQSAGYGGAIGFWRRHPHV